MDDLVQFLRARLDEDEQIAHAAGDGWYSYEPEQQIAFVPPEDSRHIARHDPGRVLAEVEAERKIIEWHKGQRDDKTPWGKPVVICYCGYDLPCSTLRLLATPYADHPEYREEWRP